MHDTNETLSTSKDFSTTPSDYGQRRLTATELGKKYGISGEMMNLILVKEGYLKGKPQNYEPTIKGAQFAHAKEYKYGPPGYANITYKYDSSILDDLNITKELLFDTKKELEVAKKLKNTELANARKIANQKFLTAQNEKEMAKIQAEMDEKHLLEQLHKIKKIGTITTIVVVIGVTGYGIYKTTPKIKAWWNKRKDNKGS